MLGELITKQEGVKYTVFHCIHFLPCIPLEYTYSFFISSYFPCRLHVLRGKHTPQDTVTQLMSMAEYVFSTLESHRVSRKIKGSAGVDEERRGSSDWKPA